MHQKIKIFHIEDYQIMRDGIRLMLQAEHDMEWVGEAHSEVELFQKAKITPIDVLLLDIFLDAMEDFNRKKGFDICKDVHHAYPSIKILAHSAYDHAESVAGILAAGGSGFVSKKSGMQDLVQGIRAVYEGKIYICPEARKRIANLNAFLLGLEPGLRSTDDLFSKREREIINLLARGLSSREIADLLFIGERTVETHRKNLIEKAGVKNTVQLIAYASQRGFLH